MSVWNFDQKITSALPNNKIDVVVSFDGDLDLDVFGTFSLVLHAEGQVPEEIFPINKLSSDTYTFTRGNDYHSWDIGSSISARLTKHNTTAYNTHTADFQAAYYFEYIQDNANLPRLASKITNTDLGGIYGVGDNIPELGVEVLAAPDADTLEITPALQIPVASAPVVEVFETIAGAGGMWAYLHPVGTSYWIHTGSTLYQLDATGAFTHLDIWGSTSPEVGPTAYYEAVVFREGVFYALISDDDKAYTILHTMDTGTGALSAWPVRIEIPSWTTCIDVKDDILYCWEGSKLITASLITGNVSAQVDHSTSIGLTVEGAVLMGTEWWFNDGSDLVLTDLNYNPVTNQITMVGSGLEGNNMQLCLNAEGHLRLGAHLSHVPSNTTLRLHSVSLVFETQRNVTLQRTPTRGDRLTYVYGKKVWR